MNRREQRGSGRLLSIEDLQAYLSLGRASAARFGSEAGAVVRVGTRLLYDRQAVDRLIEKERSNS